jgi:osmoprotectant transport system permease protein
LALYALLPIVRNTYAGILGIDPAVREAAVGMGLNRRQLLFKVELPLAAPFIFSGVRIATVTAVGVATIAAAVGAGGLGEFIFRGVAMVNNQLILAGAVPAALLAIIADVVLGFVESRLRHPRGA